MSDVVNRVGGCFSEDFLNLFSSTTRVEANIHLVWSLFRMGGSAPVDVLVTQFPELAKTDEIDRLVKIGLVRWEGAGMKEGKLNVWLLLSDELENILIRKGMSLNFENFRDLIIKKYGPKLTQEYRVSKHIASLSTVLAGIMVEAKPTNPALLSTVLKFAKANGDLKEDGAFTYYKNILDYYLDRRMGLATVNGNTVNLTEKASKIMKDKDGELWKLYEGAVKAK